MTVSGTPSRLAERAGREERAAEPEIRVIRRRHRPPAELGHQPALDGLRALAVAAVLVFHARFGWATGGFLGVSTFFTLSGFLITSLLLREWAGARHLDLRRFFGRRFRRLLPASWLTLLLVVAMGALGVWNTDQLRSLRGDVPAALLEVLNWHFIRAGRSYGDQFTAPSPLEHFWSLAVEQQFYLLLPVVVAGALAWGRSRSRSLQRAPLVAVLVVLGVVSAVLNGRFASTSVDRAYFGTDTRMAELVIGALLACACLQRFRLRTVAGRAGLGWLGLVGLVASAVLWHTATVSSSWLYPWGLLFTALCTSAMILGALQGGWFTVALSVGPLVWLGRISYGVYLLHWPVFLWLTPARTGWAPWPLFGVRMAVTLLGAVVMFKVVEHPVRTGRVLPGRAAGLLAPLAVVVLLGGTLVVTSDLPGPTSLERAGAATAPTSLPPRPLRVAVVGDELAQSAAGTLQADGGVPLEVAVASAPGCGLALGGYVRLPDGAVERDVDRCGTVKDLWAAQVARDRPDVVAVWAGLRDVADRRLSTDSPWQRPTDPELADFLRSDVGELIDTLASSGSKVVVLSVPHLRNQTPPPPVPPTPPNPDPQKAALEATQRSEIAEGVPPAGHAENEDARVDAWNAMLAEVAAARGAGFVDVAARMRSWPGGEFDPERRAGGVGVTQVGGGDLAEWLAPQLKELKPPAPSVAGAPTVAADAPLPAPPPASPRRVVPAGRTAHTLVVGDSVAHGYGYGLTQWARGHDELSAVNAGQLGCPVARGGAFRFLRDIGRFEDRCDWATLFPRFLNEQDPDVVVLSSGIWEVVDRRLPGDDRWRHVGDPGVDRYLLREFLAAIDTLGSRGATVVVLTYPHFQAGADQGFSDLPESDPARVDRLNALLGEAVAMRPGVARVIDVQGWLAAQPGGELDGAKREDGLHFRDEYVPTVAAWLGPQLVAFARGA